MKYFVTSSVFDKDNVKLDKQYLSEFSLSELNLKDQITQEKSYDIRCSLHDLSSDRRKRITETARHTAEKILLKKIKFLNHTSGIERGYDYWRIIIGPWLNEVARHCLFLGTLIEDAIATRESEEPLICPVLPRGDWKLGLDTRAMVMGMKKPMGSAVICSFLLRKRIPLNNFETEEICEKAGIEKTLGLVERKKITKKVIKKILYLIYRLPIFLRSDPIVISGVSESVGFDLRLLVKSKFRVIPGFYDFPQKTPLINRKTLPTGNPVENIVTNFEDVLSDFFDQFLPGIFSYGHGDLRQKSFGFLDPRRVCGFGGSTDWFYNEAFKVCAAESRHLRDSKLIGVQHGGAYGMLEHHPLLDEEIEGKDFYLTWGWTAPKSHPLIGLPSPKLSAVKPRKYSDVARASTILLTVSEVPIYPRWIGLNEFADAVWRRKQTQQLLIGIEKNILRRISVRPNTGNLGWDFDDSLKSILPPNYIDQRKKTFKSRLEDCSLLITNVPSTTYAEAIASNTPTLLYWNKFTPTKAFRPFLEAFKEAKIAFENGGDLASFINYHDGNLVDWWFSREIQDLRLRFLNEFYITSTSCVDDYLSFFKNIKT